MGSRDLLTTTSLAGMELGDFAVTSPFHAWRERGTGRWLLFCTTDGCGRIGHDDGEVLAGPGSLLLIAPGTRHDYGTEAHLRRWRFAWAHFVARPGWEPWLAWPEVAPGIATISPPAAVTTAVRSAILAALAHAAVPGRAQEALAANAVERALILAATAFPADRLDPRVARVIAICRHDFADDLSLTVLAARAGTSVSRLTAMFRAQVGCSVRTYIERLRLEHARTLLTHSDLPVGEIARRSGFSDPFYFSQRFSRNCGQAPSRWRQRG